MQSTANFARNESEEEASLSSRASSSELMIPYFISNQDTTKIPSYNTCNVSFVMRFWIHPIELITVLNHRDFSY